MTRTRITFLSLLLLLLSAALIVSLWSLRGIGLEAARLNAEADALSGNDSWTMGVRQIQSESAGDLKTLEEAKLSRTELVSLIETLEQAGKSMGLKVSFSSITAEGELSSSTPQTLKIVVDTEGTWRGSLAFVRLLQSLPTKASIETLTLSLSNQTWRSGTTLRVTVFPESL